MASALCSQPLSTATPEPPSGPVLVPLPNQSPIWVTRQSPLPVSPAESLNSGASQAAPMLPISVPSCRDASNDGTQRGLVSVALLSISSWKVSAKAFEPLPLVLTTQALFLTVYHGSEALDRPAKMLPASSAS